MHRNDAIEAFRAVLGREPENDAVVDGAASHYATPWDYVRALVASPEAQRRAQASLAHYLGYSEADAALVRSFHVPAAGRDGYATNFVGAVADVRIRPSLVPLSGMVESGPAQYSVHGDPAEWAGVLKAVSEAKGSFAVAELGAGWGPWLVSSSLAARSRGIADPFMVGVEADAGHFAAMHQHLIDNGFNPGEHRLLNGVVGSVSGSAYFPVIESGKDWGAAAYFSADGTPPPADYRGHALRHEKVRAYDIEQILSDRAVFDLVHVDIQGAEREVIPTSLDVLNRKVRWLVIGTHSRAIEGVLLEALSQAGWQLTNEKPAQFRPPTGRPISAADTFSDGVQVWRNPRY